MPFKEAVEFFRQKVNVPSEHWTAVMDEAHARGFAVAGATSEALISDFRAAIDKAISQGTTFQTFKKDFDEIVKRHGWSHTGTADWRAKIIYETNLRTAFAAGHYAQMTRPAVLAAFPYWEYVHTSCPNPRIQHLAWSGMVLRADDPFWATNYPPNGWGCRCTVISTNDRGLARMGKSGVDPSPDLQWRDYVNRTTGVVVKVPTGVDPGFAYNPGKAWLDRAGLPAKTPPLKAVGPAPPVLAPHGKTAVKPEVLQKFLGTLGDQSVQIAELADAPVVLDGPAVKAAAKAGGVLDAAAVAEIGAAIVASKRNPAAGGFTVLTASGWRVSLDFNEFFNAWLIAGLEAPKS